MHWSIARYKCKARRGYRFLVVSCISLYFYEWANCCRRRAFAFALHQFLELASPAAPIPKPDVKKLSLRAPVGRLLDQFFFYSSASRSRPSRYGLASSFPNVFPFRRRAICRPVSGAPFTHMRWRVYIPTSCTRWPRQGRQPRYRRVCVNPIAQNLLSKFFSLSSFFPRIQLSPAISRAVSPRIDYARHGYYSNRPASDILQCVV